MSGMHDVYGYGLPDAQVATWEDASALSRAGAPSRAADRMGDLLAALPGFVPAKVQGAFFLLASGRYRDARRWAIEAAAAAPRSSALTFEIVRLLRVFEAIPEIHALVAGRGWSDGPTPDLLVQMAAQLAPVGLYDEAGRLLGLAQAQAPRLPAIHTLQGTIAMVTGDMQAAATSFRHALASSTAELPHVRWLMTLAAPDAPEASVDAIREATAAVGGEGMGAAYLAFALHNACHADKRHPEAWAALAHGCILKRQLEPYDAGQQERLFSRLHATVPTAVDAPDHGAPGLVFIVGMHRSGTTLLERILAGHPELVDGGESYVFRAALQQVADYRPQNLLDEALLDRLQGADLAEAGAIFRAYARWRARGRGFMTEKLPSNFLLLGHILEALPEARILHMRRDPMDTCFSNLRTCFDGAARYSYDQRSLGDYYLRYRSLMQHWHEVAPGRILDVDYAALVDRPEAEARRIAAFCGLDFHDAMLAVDRAGGATATASVGHARQGILKGRGGAWRHYAEHLQPLIKTLGTSSD
jgi:tetratricopeptide (TPR) repeat protein